MEVLVLELEVVFEVEDVVLDVDFEVVFEVEVVVLDVDVDVDFDVVFEVEVVVLDVVEVEVVMVPPPGTRYQFAWGSLRHSPAVTPFQPLDWIRLK